MEYCLLKHIGDGCTAGGARNGSLANKTILGVLCFLFHGDVGKESSQSGHVRCQFRSPSRTSRVLSTWDPFGASYHPQWDLFLAFCRSSIDWKASLARLFCSEHLSLRETFSITRSLPNTPCTVQECENAHHPSTYTINIALCSK